MAVPQEIYLRDKPIKRRGPGEGESKGGEALERLRRFAAHDGVPIRSEAALRKVWDALMAAGFDPDEISRPISGLYARKTDAIQAHNGGSKTAIARYLPGQSLDGWLQRLLHGRG